MSSSMESTPIAVRYTGDDVTIEISASNQISVKDSGGILPPIGTIMPWAKTLTGTPALAANWEECNGQTISDAESPYNGVALPSLNTTNRFLRGAATSGGTGGAATRTLTTTELPAHTHTIGTRTSLAFTGSTGALQNGNSTVNSNATATDSAGSGAAFNIEPQYYNVVWIIRIK